MSEISLFAKVFEKIVEFMRFIGYKLYIPVNEFDYGALSRFLHLPFLLSRIVYLDICTSFKINDNHIDSPFLLSSLYFHVPQRNLRENRLFDIKFYRTNHGKSSPLNRFRNSANDLCVDVDFFHVRLIS